MIVKRYFVQCKVLLLLSLLNLFKKYILRLKGYIKYKILNINMTTLYGCLQ